MAVRMFVLAAVIVDWRAAEKGFHWLKARLKKGKRPLPGSGAESYGQGSEALVPACNELPSFESEGSARDRSLTRRGRSQTGRGEAPHPLADARGCSENSGRELGFASVTPVAGCWALSRGDTPCSGAESAARRAS